MYSIHGVSGYESDWAVVQALHWVALLSAIAGAAQLQAPEAGISSNFWLDLAWYPLSGWNKYKNRLIFRNPGIPDSLVCQEPT